MDLEELKQLIQILESSGLGELEIEESGKRIRLSKHAAGTPAPIFVPAPPHSAAAHAPAVGAAPVPASTAPRASTPPAEVEALEDGLVTIDSPMVGTFYASPAPGEPAFIQPGDAVSPDQTVAIVEAMKIMNEVPAKVHGVIERCLVASGEPVEFGQPLFAVRPVA